MIRPRPLLASFYRKVAAPFGLRTLQRMLRDGLPSRLEVPLRFLFTGQRSADAAEVTARIEALRDRIAARPETYSFTYRPSDLGRVRWPELAGTGSASRLFTSASLARSVSVPPRWGLFLHLCAEAVDARAILEMGACVGISGAYLASARSRPRLITLEGSAALAPVAEETLAAVTDRAEVIRAPFESGIDEALARFAEENATVDVAYVDGHHDEAATLHYVRTIVPSLSSDALVILDDIYLYAEMWRAWETLSSTQPFAAAVNVGRFGLLVRSRGSETATRYDLSKYTGWWRVGASRRDSVGW